LNGYLIKTGRITIPKSINPVRIRENFDLFDFEFTTEQLEQLDGLDKNLRYFMFDM
jgi:diketogulonate reductase-like aldo/keto reductase